MGFWMQQILNIAFSHFFLCSKLSMLSFSIKTTLWYLSVLKIGKYLFTNLEQQILIAHLFLGTTINYASLCLVDSLWVLCRVFFFFWDKLVLVWHIWYSCLFCYSLLITVLYLKLKKCKYFLGCWSIEWGQTPWPFESIIFLQDPSLYSALYLAEDPSQLLQNWDSRSEVSSLYTQCIFIDKLY